ncbi:MAG: hypothetical protein KDB52_12410 [Solirubrobacterales bacterium]|nr:hypothetical protein [Solirubrobacterales bacterium]
MQSTATSSRRLATAVAAALMGLLVLAGPAQAISETEPNNKRSEANGPIMDGDTWSGDWGVGGEYGESDWLKFYIAKPTTVSFDITRGVVLENEAGFELTHANGDSIEGGAHVLIPDGQTSGNITKALGPGKYHFWVTGILDGPDFGMTWQVTAHGDFATWAEIQTACAQGEANLVSLNKAVTSAKKALTKVQKRKAGKSKKARKAKAAAVKKAKTKLTKAQKAVATARAGSEAVCAIEE